MTGVDNVKVEINQINTVENNSSPQWLIFVLLKWCFLIQTWFNLITFNVLKLTVPFTSTTRFDILKYTSIMNNILFIIYNEI